MPGIDEHDDDLEPEVTEGAEFETVNYGDDEDLEEAQPGSDVTNSIGRADEQAPADVQEKGPEGDGSDTI